MIKKEDYEGCLKYINRKWKDFTFSFKKDKGIRVGLPNRFVAPNKGLFENDQFYWDSYFIMLGLKNKNLAKGMIDNFDFIYKRFGVIPARNRFHNVGISQVPFFTSMIMEVFPAAGDKPWLRKTAKTAESELKNYWMSRETAEKHLVYNGLSRYCDHYVTHSAAEHESGWDMTSRFNDRCLDYLPVDLNSCLYKYETDLAEIYDLLGNSYKKMIFLNQAKKRKRAMKMLMWDDEGGFFFDYNYVEKKQRRFYSTAGFYPLWAKLATFEQAESAARNLRKLECRGGIANTQKTNLLKEFRQWDYPNGWANQQWITIKGLLNYGLDKDAERIAKKWLDMNKKVFKKTRKFWEKYNVASAGVGKEGRYPNQTGFGWTNAVFVRLVDEFSYKKHKTL